MPVHNMGRESQIWTNAANTLSPKLQRFIEEEARALRDTFQERSPVRTGRFKRSWRIRKPVGSTMIAHVSIYNPIYSYGSAIEYGVDKGDNPEHVWVKSLAQRKSRIIERKVQEVKGKVYTRHAPGGIIEPLTPPSYRRDLTRRVADQVVKIISEASK